MKNIFKLIIIILLTTIILSINVNAISSNDDFKDISNFMKEICFDKSIIIIKDENAVEKFCDFVDHVLDHDYDHVLKLYYKANKNFKPLEIALGDTIKKRYYKKEERPHQLVDTFLSSLDSITDQYLKEINKKRDEL